MISAIFGLQPGGCHNFGLLRDGNHVLLNRRREYRFCFNNLLVMLCPLNATNMAERAKTKPISNPVPFLPSRSALNDFLISILYLAFYVFFMQGQSSTFFLYLMRFAPFFFQSHIFFSFHTLNRTFSRYICITVCPYGIIAQI